MKSYLFSTDNQRGGVILCDIDSLPEAVAYLQQRFSGVVRVEQGADYWSREEGLQCQPLPTDNQPAAES